MTVYIRNERDKDTCTGIGISVSPGHVITICMCHNLCLQSLKLMHFKFTCRIRKENNAGVAPHITHILQDV